MGAEDRYLVRLYRYQIECAAREVSQTIWSTEWTQKAYRFVGQVDQNAREELREAEGKDKQGRKKSFLKRVYELNWLTSWRWEPISTTRLAALFPLLVLVLWSVVLISTLSKPSS